MSVYLVHMPPDGDSAAKTALRTRFIREGFSWGAFLFGPLWLLRHRLWLELFFYFVLIGLLVLAQQNWGLDEAAATGILFLIGLLMGFEGTAMLEAKLARKRFHCCDIVAGAGRDEIERRFFARWSGTRT